MQQGQKYQTSMNHTEMLILSGELNFQRIISTKVFVMENYRLES